MAVGKMSNAYIAIQNATQVMKYRRLFPSPSKYLNNRLHFNCNHTAAHQNTPLEGVRILDLTRVLAGPFCTQILADYGADVLKIENPRGGDDTRLWRTGGEDHLWKSTDADMSAYFCAVNRNKESITLNLKEEKGQEILFRLVKSADVVVDNFVQGKMDEMGIGYQKLREVNPSIIHASVSGYGAGGPYSRRAGYDAIAAAEAGMLHITGERDGAPTRPGLGLTDMSTGLYLHGAILAALYARKNTGQGQKIDASLFESQVSLLSNVAMSWLNAGEHAHRWGTEHPSIVPYQAFKTKDGYLVLGATNNRQFQILCQLLEHLELARDPRFVDNSSRVLNRAELKGILEPIIRAKPTKDWLAVLEGSGMPYGPINTIEEVFSHPQTAARHMVHTLPHEPSVSGQIKVLGLFLTRYAADIPIKPYANYQTGFPVKFSETQPRIRRAPPSLGAHTNSTLEDMGYSPKEIAAMREQGIV
ncbi:uncharacterized protein N7515_007624 [Penicillium bovifimosum]|uniref:Uncharacterized protein n=1 Tax=Penicillium bovifimosum TaxID=126998 RepID=A0A9W9GLP7_9EURO|nr:uncharacterized protein N7515_007624 [Penicillium bovifimosum]KAJ5123799.1 hypothetical protein N7515_007624 [Penicillium bovifimosum]